MREAVYLFIIPVVLLSGCQKITNYANEIEQAIIDGYWESFDGVVIEVQDGEAMVLDFGDSPLGSAPLVFDKGTHPYLKNIERTGGYTWNAEIAVGTYDDQNTLVAFNYAPTEITQQIQGSDKTLSFSTSDPGSTTWNYQQSYTPAPCDTTSFVVLSDSNIVLQGTTEYKGTQVRCGYMRNSYPQRACIYYFETLDLKLEPSYPQRDFTLYFGEKPVPGKTYKTVSPILIDLLEPDEVFVASYWFGYPNPDGGTVSIANSGGILKATASNLSAADGDISFTIMGQ